MIGPYIVASTAGGAAVVQIVQPPIDIKLYDARDFGPVYNRKAHSLQFSRDLTDFPADALEMHGAQADGVSLLVARAIIPDNSRAKEAVLTVTTPEGSSWSAATFGGLYSEWPSASAVRDAQGQQRVVVPIKEVKNGTRTERVAVAIYHPPTRFMPDGGGPGTFLRHLNLTAETNEDHPLDGGRVIQISRRPLVLVHGYLSGPETWGSLITNLPGAKELYGIAINAKISYKDINTSGVDLIYKRIPQALDYLREDLKVGQRIAATQFNVLAHSMGGLATWTYVSDLDNAIISRQSLPNLSRAISRSTREYFRQSDNFGAGTISRIITIGTPYRGTDVADWILAFLKCTDGLLASVPSGGGPLTIRNCAPKPVPEGLPQEVFEALLREALVDWVGTGDRSAYADFAASSLLSDPSSALSLLWGTGQSDIPTHTISGIAYEGASCQETKLARLGWNLPFGQSDLIVGSQSAIGNLEGDFTESLGGVCHTQETGSRLIISRPGQPAPLPKLLNDITGDGKFYPPGLPKH
jgi:pimeloyl-ACP methyl ester carboxylesterase